MRKKQTAKPKPLSAIQCARLESTNSKAQEVFVAGSFNDWQLRATPLQAGGDGKWSVELSLAPGRYEYRFIADGEWAEDPAAQESVPNPFGGRNSVLVVPSRAVV